MLKRLVLPSEQSTGSLTECLMMALSSSSSSSKSLKDLIILNSLTQRYFSRFYSRRTAVRFCKTLDLRDETIGRRIGLDEEDCQKLSVVDCYPRAQSSFEIRPYQNEAIAACTDALRRGVSRMGVSLPTGSGKTTVFINLIHQMIISNRSESSKSMIIVNSLQLANQTISQLKKLHPKTVISLEQGKNLALEEAQVVVATYQSLNSKQRYQRFEPDSFGVIVVDEAHHALSNSYLRILSHFNSDIQLSEQSDSKNLSKVSIIGFSATFARHDRLALSKVFEEIVYHYELSEMIQTGWLSPVSFTSVKVEMDLSGVRITSGKEADYVPESLVEVVDTDEINMLLTSIYLDQAKNRKSTLIFAVNVQHVHRLAIRFRDRGIDARVIVGGTPVHERRSILDDFRLLKFPVLINCAILTEGADIPNVDCIILARPTRSRTLMTQMIGRGLRRSDLTGKKDCQVIDIFGSVLGGMIVKPTLDGLDLNQLSSDDFNSDRNHSFEKPTREGEGFTESLSYREPISIKSLTFTHFESPFLDEPEFVLARDLHKLTRHSWVGCGAGIYVLDLLGHGHLRIQPERKSSESIEFIIYLSWSINVDKNSKKRLVKPFEIGKAQKLEEAIRTADSFLRIAVRQNRYNLTFGLLQSLSRSASWRKGRISDQQRSILKAKIFKDNEEDDDDGEKRLMNLNKGQAANLLTRLYHGFKRRLEKRVKDDETMKRKIEKLKLNEKFGRSRIIKVGKLKT